MFRGFSRLASSAARNGTTYRRVASAAAPRVFNASRLVTLAAATAASSVAIYAWQQETHADALPPQGVPGTKHERTFIAVKPDGVQRGIVGEIIRRFETKGYKLVAIKMIRPTEEFAAQHYDDLKSKPFFPGLVKFFSSGPVVAMVWEGQGVIKGGRTLLGATNPADSLPGSIRGDLSVVVGRNICHGSDSADAAADEIKLWWKPEELQDYERPQDAWVYDK